MGYIRVPLPAARIIPFMAYLRRVFSIGYYNTQRGAKQHRQDKYKENLNIIKIKAPACRAQAGVGAGTRATARVSPTFIAVSAEIVCGASGTPPPTVIAVSAGIVCGASEFTLVLRGVNPPVSLEADSPL
jgi:hypothetical protein